MKLHLKNKRVLQEHKPYTLDSIKTYHFFPDCPDIIGKSKAISNHGCFKYHLCNSCKLRYDNDVHNIAYDFNNNIGDYIQELVDNVNKSDMPDTKRVETLRYGLIQIKMMQFVFNSLDSMINDKR